MKKSIVAIIIAILVSLFTAAAMADSKPISMVTVPVNGMGIYYLDPDNSVRTIRTEKVTVQKNVSKYANNGYLVGQRAGDDTLLLGLESHEVAVYGLEIVDFEKLPQEVLEMMISMNNGTISSSDFWSWFCQYTVSRITRIETVNGNKVGTTLNAEVYAEKLHGKEPVVRLTVGTKKNQFWNVYERELNGAKIWVLVLQGKQGSKPTQPTPQPEQPTPEPVEPTPTPVDVDPTPVWEDPTPDPTPAPTEEPWDPGFNFDPTPAPVTPAPVTPAPATPTPVPVTPEPQEDPAPVWEEPAQQDPAPVWDDAPAQQPAAPQEPAAPQQTAAPQQDPSTVWDDAPATQDAAPQDDWDAGFNF